MGYRVIRAGSAVTSLGRFFPYLVSLLVSLSPALPQVPGILRYQGRLTCYDTNLTGTAQFKFALVDATGANAVWCHNGKSNDGGEPSGPPISVQVDNGLFSVNLGDLTVSNMSLAVSPSVFTNNALFLRVWVCDSVMGSQRLHPDQRISAVGYAMVAQTVLDPIADRQLSPNIARLNENQIFQGSNSFLGLVRLTNTANVLVGTHRGDGSGLVNLSAANFSGSLAGDVVGTQTTTKVNSVGGLAAASLADGAKAANSASSANAAGTIVKRDAYGNFAAATVSGSFVGDGNGLSNLDPNQLSGPLPSSLVEPALPSGITVVSMSAQDSGLNARGYRSVMTIPAPAWVTDPASSPPSERSGHTALWTGAELIIWGGTVGTGYTVDSGGIWQPACASWVPTSILNAPLARTGHTAVWSGTEMLVWGGKTVGSFPPSGGRFLLRTQNWLSISTNSAPPGRKGHVAVWTGTQMFIWGGQNDQGFLNDGALYDPVMDQWTPITLPNSPEPRAGATAVWTGNRLLIWGGEGTSGSLNSGAQLYFSATGTPMGWINMSSTGCPQARRWHSAVWARNKMVVWGGQDRGVVLDNGGSYLPLFNTWEPLPGDGAPTARAQHLALWTGQEMLVWGGTTGATEVATGGAYDPLSRQWRALTTAGNPQPRAQASAAWTGSELVVFGGLVNDRPVGILQRLVPQPDWFLYRKL